MPDREQEEPEEDGEAEKEAGESQRENRSPESKSNLAAWLTFAGVIVAGVFSVIAAWR